MPCMPSMCIARGCVVSLAPSAIAVINVVHAMKWSGKIRITSAPGNVEGIAGSTIMGDGKVVMIADIAELVNNITDK